MRIRRLAAAACLAAAVLGACGREERGPAEGTEEPAFATADQDSAVIRTVRLVDAQPWEDMITSGTRYRIEVRTAAGIDTLAGVMTADAPAVTGDRVWGFAIEADGLVSGGFVYDARAGSLERIPLPADFLGFTAFDLSAEAGRLAYVGRAEDGERLAAIVRSWPAGELLYRSEPVEGYPSDDTNSEVTWLGRDSVEIRIRLNVVEPDAATWLSIRGVPGRTMAADTIREQGG